MRTWVTTDSYQSRNATAAKPMERKRDLNMVTENFNKLQEYAAKANFFRMIWRPLLLCFPPSLFLYLTCFPASNSGELTDLRTALVSNINLAIVAVRFNIHRYLDQTDPALWKNIGEFAQVVLEEPFKLWQLEDQYSGPARSLSYKVLGDMVEAIIGAVHESPMWNFSFDRSSEKVLVDDEQNGGRGGGNRRTVCRIQATHKGRTLVAEGPNLRAAKLAIAHQLGVSFG
ncbi:unnamed protein product [Dibothriocephalus latus]|uniref:RNase III domain-containing protein n=1 Tax=Dibothriocephalus latus TaxID=60516 RepID=A0A3P7MD55_DIBLA|nr:unnamed protein product [Dibothriocephalus latus]